MRIDWKKCGQKHGQFEAMENYNLQIDPKALLSAKNFCAFLLFFSASSSSDVEKNRSPNLSGGHTSPNDLTTWLHYQSTEVIMLEAVHL